MSKKKKISLKKIRKQLQLNKQINSIMNEYVCDFDEAIELLKVETLYVLIDTLKK